ncbi:uncharacterized protein [Ptychodera flava]|uniref:uncharacterized protein n=1 Tax=Ptychodera flava TaxID=63121 RepID=UPI00396A2264
MIDLSTTTKNLNSTIHLSEEFKLDVQWWCDFLPTWNGSASMLQSSWISSPDMELYTDASAKHGYGIFYKGHWISAPWPNQITENNYSIAWMELLPILLSCLIWGHLWATQRVLFHCDNMSVVQIWKKGSSACPRIMNLIRRIFFTAASRNFHVMIVHIEGVNNDIADCLSRQQIPKFRKLVPSADSQATNPPDLHTLDYSISEYQ